MTEEPIDITDVVKVFGFELKTEVQPQSKDGEFVWNFPTNPVNTNLKLGFDGDWTHLLRTDEHAMMKMYQRGKYWFDTQIEADVIMSGMKYSPDDGTMTAIYNVTNIKDLTNYGWLARFLRWILRR